jgi:hypothetical protein
MTKHLVTCPQRQAAIATAEQGKGKPEDLLHLRVEDADSKDFWLDLEMRGSRTLSDLDDYLRSIWLECCGHLSQFSLASFGQEVGKRKKVQDIFQRTAQLAHDYDFGTTSTTLVKVVSARNGKPTTKYPIALMARNLMPTTECITCGKPASYLCMECVYEDENRETLCKTHAAKHPHKNYGDPLPLVNSPRTGMCGYDGPAEPPY